MRTFSMLVLTDHRTHSGENSIYALVRELQEHPLCGRLDIASRGNPLNESFFAGLSDGILWISPVDASFAFHADGHSYRSALRKTAMQEYDMIFLRLPPPVEPEFWSFLHDHYPPEQIINRPLGISATSSKAFLLNFPDVCPPMKLCSRAEDILEFRSRHPVILKPLSSYGGRGIIKIDRDRVWIGREETDIYHFLRTFEAGPRTYLGMQFLPNVSQGDKRIIVINGQILGAALRLPPPDSWLCNAAQGGAAVTAEADADEQAIAGRILPRLKEQGIVMFGFDTLVDDNGRRVLSEINTMSIGGLTQIGALNGRPVVRQAAHLIWDYIKDEVYGSTAPTAR